MENEKLPQIKRTAFHQDERCEDIESSICVTECDEWSGAQVLGSSVVMMIFQWSQKATRCLQHPEDLWANRFRVIEQLGKGAQGRVFRAVDLQHGEREVALKLPFFDRDDETLGFIPPSQKKCQSIDRWIREFNSHQRLSRSHSGVVPVLDCAMPDSSDFEEILAFLKDRPIWLTMPVCRKTLADYLVEQGGILSVAEAERIMLSIALTLRSIHDFGTDILHCDLKPSNVLLNEEGTPFLADFGLSTQREEQSFHNNPVDGTPSCMSPEQYLGQAVTHATDIWAWGVMFYYLLSGKLPFQGSFTEWDLWIRSDVPAPSLANQNGIPVYLANIIGGCLHKSLGGRYGSFLEIIDALDSLEHEPYAPPTRRQIREKLSEQVGHCSPEFAAELSDFLKDDGAFRWWGVIDPSRSWQHGMFQDVIDGGGARENWRVAILRQDDALQTEQWLRITSLSWRAPIPTLLLVENPTQIQDPIATCILNLADQASRRFRAMPRIRMLLCSESTIPDLRHGGNADKSIRIRSHLHRFGRTRMMVRSAVSNESLHSSVYSNPSDYWYEGVLTYATDDHQHSPYDSGVSPTSTMVASDERRYISRLVDAINGGNIARLASIQFGTPRNGSAKLEAVRPIVDLLVKVIIQLTAGNLATVNSLVGEMTSRLAVVSEHYQADPSAIRPILVAVAQNIVRSQGRASQVSRAIEDSMTAFAIMVKDDELMRTVNRAFGARQ